MQIAFNNGNDKEYKLMLNKLLKDIFFDFQFWYDLNVWDEKYESYSIIENDEIVSNIVLLLVMAFSATTPIHNLYYKLYHKIILSNRQKYFS